MKLIPAAVQISRTVSRTWVVAARHDPRRVRNVQGGSQRRRVDGGHASAAERLHRALEGPDQPYLPARAGDENVHAEGQARATITLLRPHPSGTNDRNQARLAGGSMLSSRR